MLGTAPMRTRRAFDRVIESTHKMGKPGEVKYNYLRKLLKRLRNS